jgi:hypothetical protein
MVSSEWRIDRGATEFVITVPPNTTADVSLPNGQIHTVGPGAHRFRSGETPG